MKRLIPFLILSSVAFGQYRVVKTLPAATNTGKIVLLSTDSTYYQDGATLVTTGKKGDVQLGKQMFDEEPWTYVYCTADSANNSRAAGLDDKIVSLDMALLANTTYEIEYRHYYTSGQAATGICITPVMSGSVTSLVGYSQIVGSAADGSDNLLSGSHLASADTVINALTAVLTGLTFGETKLVIVTDANARTLSLYIKSEITGQTITYKAGSWARFRKALATTW
jgi:hypothetical protein